MRGFRPELLRADLPAIAAGGFLTVGAAFVSMRIGGTFSLGFMLTLALFFGAVVGFIAFPHITVATIIPLFVAIPAVKVIAVPWFGPIKDILTLAGAIAAAVLVVQRAGEGHEQKGDFWSAALVAFLIGIYFVNLGGSMEHDIAWAQGIRLASEPLLLLLIGLVLPQPRRSFRWAMSSLIATGFVVALVGIAQQLVGEARLVELGYSYDGAIRTIHGHLRSFGTMDEPFAYAAFLLVALFALLMWSRRGFLTVFIGTVIATGVIFSYVRSALIITIALLGIWLARTHRPTLAAFLLAVAVVTASSILIWSSEGTESKTVQNQNSMFLTVNGRTEAWKLVLDSPRTWMVGKGVGEVGTALERSRYSVSLGKPDQENASAVDSGYFAAIADVGIIGLVALLALFGRLYYLAKRAIDRGLVEGWLAAGFLTILVLDAVTRASFTGFPTAFLILLLVGICLAAAAEATEDQPASHARAVSS
jgi:hypothetical protein